VARTLAEGVDPEVEVNFPGLPPAKQIVEEVRPLLGG
jgi:hypothetical protein